MVTVDGTTIAVETKTLSARIERGFLTSLQSKTDGQEWLSGGDTGGSALQLHYPGQANVDVVGRLAAEVAGHQLSPTSAQLRFSGWDADGVLTVSEDLQTGDLIVEPAAYSSRSGVLSARWLLKGIGDDVDLVAPFFQGVKLSLQDTLLNGRWAWPMFWEAGLVIFQGRDGGFWVHCQDDRYRYKALHIAEGVLALETEAYGPLDSALGAGGLEWRINVHQGDWQQPAGRYRDWLWRTYSLGQVEAARKPWLHDIRFALSWYGGDPEILDAIAEKIDPSQVLIHYSQWRTDAYDENYPTYEPSAAALTVFEKANAMGFHIMPHCNSVDMDPTNEAYAYLRDFQYRDVESKRLHGWGYDTEHGGVLGVPNSYHSLSRNRRRKVMIKAHPGLAMWRSILAENIQAAVEKVGTDAVFIDVTLCSGNLHNCLVENTTSTEGMNRLIRQIGALGDGLAVGGEGLNEITMQGCSFSQAHLFRSWHTSDEGLDRAGGCALNEFLWGKISRTFGYSGLRGDTEDSRLRMRIHEEHGAIPTVTVRSADEIRNPNAGVKRALDLATE
jgi:hypothetical protein